MTYPTPSYPPPAVPPPASNPWWRRGWGIAAIAVATLLVGTGIGTSAGTTKTKTEAGPTVTATATTTTTAPAPKASTVTLKPTINKIIATRTHVVTHTYTPPPPRTFGEGTYVVGVDIQPGYFHTTGGNGCYWARLASLNTSNIIDNNISSGPQTVQIMPSDRAFEISGSCRWSRR